MRKLKPLSLAMATALALALVLAPAADAAARRWLVIVDGGHKAGEQILDCSPRGECRASFVFKDNGRGPEIAETFRLAADGSFADYRATGKTTFGSSVDERFSSSAGRARWQSTTERGETREAAGRLYVPMNGSAAVWELMLQLTAGRATPLGLLPAGEVARRTLATLTVGEGATRREVELVAFNGLGLTPEMVWWIRHLQQGRTPCDRPHA